jgi:hypothetical protein
MMLADAVEALHTLAERLGAAGQRLAAVDPGAGAFGAGGLGLLGEVGREAYVRFQVALDARVAEARAHAERVREFAEAVGRTAGGFADAEDQAAPDRERPGAPGAAADAGVA